MRKKFEAYRLSRRAEIDLADIYAYTVSQWSVDQANSYTADIRAALSGLVEGIKIGRARDDIAAGYFSYRVAMHLIIYRQTAHILVVRILHASMELPRYLTD